jgi:hypothetical protein
VSACARPENGDGDGKGSCPKKQDDQHVDLRILLTPPYLPDGTPPTKKNEREEHAHPAATKKDHDPPKNKKQKKTTKNHKDPRLLTHPLRT